MSTNTTTTLSETMQTYYVKTFLERAEEETIHEQGAQERMHPANNGKSVRFTRYTVPAVVTSALTEGNNPSEYTLSAVNVDATLAEYGRTFKLSRFLTLTDIDENNSERIELAGQNMGESRDAIVRNELFTGATSSFANAKSVLSSVAASDTLDAAEVRLLARDLKNNKARRMDGSYPWVGKINPYTGYDLTGDSTWENAKTYSDVEDLYKGEIGALHGARLVETTQPYTQASTTTVYSNFFHGAHAFGVVELEGDKMDIHIVPHTQIDSGNPAGRVGFISWAGSMVAKTLNSDWLLDLQSGATA